MAFSHTYDVATPVGSADTPQEADDRMREIKASVQERLNVEHVFDLTGTEVSHANTGKHTDITTTSIANAGALANVGNLTVNTDKFTIDAATGNVVVAGTLNVAGAAEIIGVATLGDASLLKTTAAPTTDAMIANKKYVDDQISAAVPDDNAFGSWASRSNNTVYLAASDGFVLAYDNYDPTTNLYGYTDGSNPPTTLRQQFRIEANANAAGGITMPVKKGDYWKIVGANTVYWLPLGG